MTRNKEDAFCWRDDMPDVRKRRAEAQKLTAGGPHVPTRVSEGLAIGEDTYYLFVAGAEVPGSETNDLYAILARSRFEFWNRRTRKLEIRRRSDGKTLAANTLNLKEELADE